MPERRRIAVWHNLPSGGGKRLLMQQVRTLALTMDVHLYSTSLSPEEFCPIAPYATSATIYPLVPVTATGLRKIMGRWRLADQIKAIGRAAAQDMAAKGIDTLYAAACQVEHSPSILTAFVGRTVYSCQEGLREYYEPQAKPAGLKALVGQLLARPELLRRARRDRSAVLACDAIVSNSRHSQEKLKQWYGVDSTIVYPGIDLERFEPQAGFAGWGSEPTFLSVGRLGLAKGHDTVLEAVALLPESYRSLTVVCDEAPDQARAELAAQAEQLGVHLRIAHRISDDELVRLYRSAWAVVCAQRNEPFGFIPLEAMSCGCPVVAVREGGMRETVVDGVGGLVAARNPAELAGRINRLLDGAAARTALQRSALEHVRAEWSWQRSAEKLAAVISPHGR